MESKHSILYIDDEKRSLSAFRMAFEDDFDIHTAEDTAQAYEILKSRRIHLIVADHRMPEETGVDFLNRIRTEFPFTVRTILTGYSDLEAIIDAVNQSHIYYYFKKPWREEELQLVFRNAIEAVELSHDNVTLASDLKEALEELQRKARDLEEEISENKDLIAKLEEADAIKTQFLSMISHELRTPLNPIIGYTELMLRETPPESLRVNLEVIQRCGKDLLNLINSILEFIQTSSREQVPTNELIDLRVMFDDMKRVATSQLADKQGVEIKTQMFIDGTEEAVPPFLSDREAIRQILSNLVINACKFTHAGQITIKAQLATETDTLELTVSDTGIGIEASDQERIFDAFTQVDQSFARPYEGLGLGLAICKQHAQRIGGALSLESNPDEGSVFKLSIKFERANELPTEIKPSTLPSYDYRTLIIEDNEQNRSLLQAMLKRLGCETTAVSDGNSALEAFERQPFDIIFIDLLMPTMSGYEVARRIRASAIAKQPRLIAVTADLSGQAKKEIFKSGIDSVIYKPLKIAELAQHIASEQQ